MLFGGFDKFVLLDKEVERNLKYRGYGSRPDLDYGRYRRGPWYYRPSYYGPAYYSPLVSYSAHRDDQGVYWGSSAKRRAGL